MRPGRLATLIGTLAATAALYLPHLAVDEAGFRAATGSPLPSIWAELGGWGRPAAALLAAALVAAAFRPVVGRGDAWGGLAAAVLAAGGVAGGWLARTAAVADASAVAAALGEAGSTGRAMPGPGFWVLLAGAALAAGGALWDLVAALRTRAERGDKERSSVGEHDPAALQ